MSDLYFEFLIGFIIGLVTGPIALALILPLADKVMR
jgi:hypothetical protein